MGRDNGLNLVPTFDGRYINADQVIQWGVEGLQYADPDSDAPPVTKWWIVALVLSDSIPVPRMAAPSIEITAQPKMEMGFKPKEIKLPVEVYDDELEAHYALRVVINHLRAGDTKRLDKDLPPKPPKEQPREQSRPSPIILAGPPLTRLNPIVRRTPSPLGSSNQAIILWLDKDDVQHYGVNWPAPPTPESVMHVLHKVAPEHMTRGPFWRKRSSLSAATISTSLLGSNKKQMEELNQLNSTLFELVNEQSGGPPTSPTSKPN